MVALGDDEAEVFLGELFIGEGCELVDTEFVSPVFVHVVGLDLLKVGKEDTFAVHFLELGLEVNTELGLPLFELRDLRGLVELTEEDAHGSKHSQQDCNLFSSHLY